MKIQVIFGYKTKANYFKRAYMGKTKNAKNMDPVDQNLTTTGNFDDTAATEWTKNTDNDYLVRATALDGAVQAIAVRHTSTCREMTEIHSLSPIVAAALGRLCGGLMLMSVDLKSDEATVSATIKSDGPLKGMFAVCSADAMVKGYVVNPAVETTYKENGKLDVGGVVGKGTLTIIKDTGTGSPYIGQVELVSGEIAEDLAAYYLFSEQIPTVMSLGVRMNREGITHAGGLMIRLLPDAGEDIITYIEQRATGFPEISWLYEEGFTPHQVLDLFLGDYNIIYHDVKNCGYKCTCSEERMSANLITLGKEELTNLATDPKGIELECHFCNKKYNFTSDRVKQLMEGLDKKRVN
jgi:molecular chaperone Hsp33